MPTLLGVRKNGNNSGAIELSEKKLIRRYSLEYLVRANSYTQGPLTIAATSGLPLVGFHTYSFEGESDLAAVCKRKISRRDQKHPLVWYVNTEFDNDPNSQSQENESDSGSAVDRPAIISWGAEYGEEVLYKDFSSPRKDVVTPAGNAFDPPLVRKVIYPVCTIERYQASFGPAVILAYEDRTNSADFMGAPPGSALMAEIRAAEVIEDSTKLWRVTYRIRFTVSPDGFKHMPLNQDYQYKENPSSTSLTNTTNGQLGNLNLDGTRAALGTRTYGGADGAGFRSHLTADFDDLALV